MLKISNSTFLDKKKQFFVKENEESFVIYLEYYIFEIESSKLINYSAAIYWICPSHRSKNCRFRFQLEEFLIPIPVSKSQIRMMPDFLNWNRNQNRNFPCEELNPWTQKQIPSYIYESTTRSKKLVLEFGGWIFFSITFFSFF